MSEEIANFILEDLVHEGAELHVPLNDSVIPSKLLLLASQGWTISDAWNCGEGKGFNLLFTRKKVHTKDGE